MKSKALIKKQDGVEMAKLCRWCLSNCDAVESLTCDELGQYKHQKIFDFTGLQIEFSPGVPSYLCTMCESRLKKMDRFRWRCNEKIDLVDKLVEQQNRAKYESEITQDHLDYSAEQTVFTEMSIKTEVSSPDAAKDLHLNQKGGTVHQANRTSECGNTRDDLLEADEKPITIKLEYEEVDEQHQLQTTNDVLDNQNNLKSRRKNKKHRRVRWSSRLAQSFSPKIRIPTPTDEKPYHCIVCEKVFRSSNTLAQHSKIHNKDEHYQCPHCSSTFAQLSNLKIHIRTHTGERPYQCEICYKAFYSPSSLLHHSKIHNKDLQHQCSYCSSTFAQLSNLKIHIRTHTGERPYQCKICGKAFYTSSYLTKHSKIHNKNESQ